MSTQCAVNVELPAVVDAAQAVLLVAAPEQAGAAVGAALVDARQRGRRVCRKATRSSPSSSSSTGGQSGSGSSQAAGPAASSGASARPSACRGRRGQGFVIFLLSMDWPPWSGLDLGRMLTWIVRPAPVPATASRASRARLSGKACVAIFSIGSLPEAMNWIASSTESVGVAVGLIQLIFARPRLSRSSISRPAAARTMLHLRFAATWIDSATVPCRRRSR